jgi:hypothetical protein
MATSLAEGGDSKPMFQGDRACWTLSVIEVLKQYYIEKKVQSWTAFSRTTFVSDLYIQHFIYDTLLFKSSQEKKKTGEKKQCQSFPKKYMNLN